MSDIRVECESQVGTSNRPARVLIYHDEQLVMEVEGTIEYQSGTDRRQYPCIVLKNIGLARWA